MVRPSCSIRGMWCGPSPLCASCALTYLLDSTARDSGICASGCVLHDFGKAAGGFQQQVRPGGTIWGKRHEVLSLAFLDWIVPDAAHPDRTWLGAAVASHHKDIDTITDRYPLDEEPNDDVLYGMVRDLSPDALTQLWESSPSMPLRGGGSTASIPWGLKKSSRLEPGMEARPRPAMRLPSICVASSDCTGDWHARMRALGITASRRGTRHDYQRGSPGVGARVYDPTNRPTGP